MNAMLRLLRMSFGSTEKLPPVLAIGKFSEPLIVGAQA